MASRQVASRKRVPVFLPGKLHGQRSLVGYSSWGHKESDTTERLNSIMHVFYVSLFIVHFSVAKSCLTLWNPVDCSMPGFPVLHHLPEFAQTHIH